ncbi:hypothetical protein BLJ79_13470 [Arthrobacter sp. UCD-GKA]|uniref:hypothetical protein n=1 Tax=Arthrobacter sp. UCD-GKA TaxID=1913576 RepID=UPI0008DE1E7B|nr:hypothetical protein [Arthrobacter sp. UCD-GKA]OIH83715.1 hypothetical protein BLJ79_13470 [Arthrobacter sp. UCD-GKA]
MHELDLIHAAAEDVASARVLLQERMAALDAIVQTALDHGIPEKKVNVASEPSLLRDDRELAGERPMLAA